jgi:hypothetical protein
LWHVLFHWGATSQKTFTAPLTIELLNRVLCRGYEAFVDGEWTAVPNEIILRRHDNPTGGAVLCVEPLFRRMLCFVPGTQM